jgi:threonine dehydrogenase-like Zn-dependent dehydrogenase
MEYGETGRVMGHEAIGGRRSVGADVRTLKVGDLVVMPFAYSGNESGHRHRRFLDRASGCSRR